MTYFIRRGKPPLALTHKGEYPQDLDGPFAAAMVAASPSHFLIFTDSFASNPGNIQGPCGASPTGERYLHVVALAPQPRETLSMLVESCRSNLGEAHAPHWDATGRTLTVSIQNDSSAPATTTYHLGRDGDVKKNTRRWP